jgi:biopolymer transport protein ExbB/TolQ
MTLTERLLNIALFGASWVLWLLIALSVISIAVMLERARYFRRTALDPDSLRKDLSALIAADDLDTARERIARHEHSLEGGVLLAGLAKADDGTAAVRDAMASAKIRGRLRVRTNLAFLGTLGNNAPFIGLFGTVLGIIKAFHDLAAKKGQGPEAVMGSLSEALIATAVGLLVAIPAVTSFNYFQGKVRLRLAQSEALSFDLLSDLDGREHAQGKA